MRQSAVSKPVKNSIFILLIAMSAMVFSCNPDDKFVEEIAHLEFFDDTVQFDTIFTSVGSATEVFLIYNRGDENMLLNSIELAGGKGSPYRLNFDGVSDTRFEDVELLAGDSLYGFVEVTIDPSDESLPFVVKDSILFKSGGGQMDLKLISWGQNAIFHSYDTIKTDETWSNNAPHVLYGNVRVAKGAVLTIEEGTQIFGHSLSRLIIGRRSSLQILGSVDFPVVFQGDRKEERYDELPGQWFGIQLLPGSVNNYIRHAVIKNGHRGIEIDSMPASKERNLLVENTSIRSMSQVCILGYTANIRIVNSELIDACEFLFVGELGGTYELVYTTLGNFQKTCVRTDPSVYLSNSDYEDPVTKDIITNDLSFNIINSIIYGGEEDEFIINASGTGNPPSGNIQNSIVKSENEDLIKLFKFSTDDPKFAKPGELNYQLDTLSPAIGKASPDFGWNTDFFEKSRDPVNPDMGAFERDE